MELAGTPAWPSLQLTDALLHSQAKSRELVESSENNATSAASAEIETLFEQLTEASFDVGEKLHVLAKLRSAPLVGPQLDRLDAILGSLVEELRRSEHSKLPHFAREWAWAASGRHAFQSMLRRAEFFADQLNDIYLHLCAARAAIHLSRTEVARIHARRAYKLVEKTPAAVPHLLSIAEDCGLDGVARRMLSEVVRNDSSRAHIGILERIEVATHNRRPGSVCHSVSLVSLGNNCLPWLVPNKWGLRPNLQTTRIRTPFNLALWRFPGIVRALEQRFDSLADPAEYRWLDSPKGLRLPHHKSYAATLNHEAFLRGDSPVLDAVLEEYDFRRRNFLSDGCAGPRVYLYWNERPSDLERLAASLVPLARDEQFLLLVIDVCNDPEWLDQSFTDTQHLRVRRLCLPTETFQWHQEGDSEIGIRFERKIHDLVLNAMNEIAKLCSVRITTAQAH